MTAKGTPPAGAARLELIADRYRVEREVGRGGMATVYLCEDLKEGGHVAVKVLRAELGSAVVVERFLREIKFASELDHPQIPKVLDSGVVEGLPFYVMTFIDGESLRSRLDREKQFPIDEVIRIMSEVIRPTAYAHERGIVHRDIKPGNILIAKDSVYVLDFGVARAIVASAEDSLTSTGVAVGTPAYMSPEQALADHNVDHRSDIYSLGCVAYEMIAGIPPFVGATPQSVMARRFIAPPPPLHEVRDLVPPEIEAAIMRSLARSPADRWQRISDFGRALTGDPTSPSIVTQRVMLAQRKRRLGWGVLGAGVAALALAGGVWAYTSRDHVASGRAAFEQWQIPLAEMSLAKAVARDANDPNANLWMGQLLILKGVPQSEWAPFVLRALDAKSQLPPQDRPRAEALAAFADARRQDRCGLLRQVVGRPDASRPQDFSATIALADCLRADRRVVPDSASPTGYAFASSYEEAADLYEGVIARNVRNPAAYEVIMPRIAQVLWTNKNRFRGGTLVGESDVNFVAMPELISDSVAYIPYKVAGTGAPARPDPSRLDRAVAANLERLQALATQWVRAQKTGGGAHEALATILESRVQLDGSQSSALASLRAARSERPAGMSADSLYLRTLRLSSANVRILLKLGRFGAAAALADSTLGLNQPAIRDEGLKASIDTLHSGLLALTGHVHRVVAIDKVSISQAPVRLPSGEVKQLTAELGSELSRLTDYAAFGLPRDSVIAISERLYENLESLVRPSEVAAFRAAILRRPLSLAVNVTGTRPLARLGPSSDIFSNAVIALDRGDRATARRLADSLETFRSGSAPGEVTMDVVFQEAWLRTAIGDSAKAAQSLDRALGGLSRAPQNLLRDAILPASLVRVMLLRAALGDAAGDTGTAQQWRNAARSLWGKGDPEVRQALSGPAR